MHRSAVMVALFVLVCGCSRFGGGGSESISLGGADQGGTYDANVGDTLVVSLEENPSTGYAWSIDEVDPAVARMVRDEYVAPATDRLGAAGVHEFEFEVMANGDTAVRLVYRRAWEEDVPPLEVWEIRLSVR